MAELGLDGNLVKVKKCSKCGVEKPETEFGKASANPDGLKYSCKPCEVVFRKSKYRPAVKTTKPAPAPGFKRCFTCKYEKPVLNFSKSPLTKDKLASSCKDCDREYKKYATTPEGRAAIDARKARKVAANPGHKVCVGCFEEKLLAEFSKRERSPDGVNSRCKGCANKRHKATPSAIEAAARRAEKTGSPGLKICQKCHTAKPYDKFYKNKTGLFGRNSTCKACEKEVTSAIYASSPKGLAAAARRELKRIKNQAKPGHKKCNKCKTEKHHSEFSLSKRSQDGFHYKCRACVSLYNTEYLNNNRAKLNASILKRCNQRRKEDVNFKLKTNLRNRITKMIRGHTKGGSAVDDLGCSVDFLKTHLEQGFYLHSETNEQMSWDNYGRWHVDHIIPLAAFDLTDREQFLKACNYTNLQPLWAKDNASKKASLDWKRVS